MATYPKIIKLNVGGLKYQTSLTTLQTYPDSMLGRMFGGNFQSTVNENGEYFIDANGEIFKYILDFLRRDKLMLPDDFKEFDLLMGEADFYQIQPLIDKIIELRTHRDKKETTSLLCVWTTHWFSDEMGDVYGHGLYSAYVKSSGLFQKISLDDYGTSYDNVHEDLKKEGYKLVKKTDELPYDKLRSALVTFGVTSLPKPVGEDGEGTDYVIEIWAKIEMESNLFTQKNLEVSQSHEV